MVEQRRVAAPSTASDSGFVMTPAEAMPSWLPPDIAAAIEKAGITVGFADRDCSGLLYKGADGLGALILVDDRDPAIGPWRFGIDFSDTIERCHGVFIVDGDAFDKHVASLVQTAMGSLVFVIVTDATNAADWSELVAEIAPGVIRMTVIGAGAPSQSTVGYAGAA
jgi:hypothetical protein